MKLSEDIVEYNQSLDNELRSLAEAICKQFGKQAGSAEGKVWHGHPVWFIEGNPVFGYSLKKSGIEVLFWSGQSFKKPGLRAIGKFKAAACEIKSAADVKDLAEWMQEALVIQWDYKNLPKVRSLKKLSKF